MSVCDASSSTPKRMIMGSNCLSESSRCSSSFVAPYATPERVADEPYQVLVPVPVPVPVPEFGSPKPVGYGYGDGDGCHPNSWTPLEVEIGSAHDARGFRGRPRPTTTGSCVPFLGRSSRGRDDADAERDRR